MLCVLSLVKVFVNTLLAIHRELPGEFSRRSIREAQLPDVNSITAEKGLERQSRSQSRMLLS